MSWYVMCEEPVWIVTFTLVAVALTGGSGSPYSARPRAGFIAGIALSFAVCTDMVAIGIVVMLALAVPVFARQRYRHHHQATLATLAVLLFPSAAALAGWAFMEWRFAGTVANAWRLAWTGTPFTEASNASPYDLLTFGPYLVFWAALGVNFLLKRQYLAFAAYLIPELALAAMRLLAWPYMQQGKS